MNVISGLETPTRGEIYFDGQPVSRIEPGRRNVGFVFQNYAIFTHMRVYDNLAFGLRVRKPKPPKEEIDREVRRVAAIVLLDEPFSNLDAAFRAYMRAELKRIQHEIGQTMVYVTHDQVEAMGMADRIAVMNLGVLQQFGTPHEIYNSPANRFVAGFVGSTQMNFLPAGEVPIDLPASARNGREVTVGIRPENLSLVPPDSAEAALKAKVTLVEPLGAKDVVHVTVDRHDIRVIATPGTRPRIGEDVGIVLDRERLHVFDDETGEAVR